MDLSLLEKEYDVPKPELPVTESGWFATPPSATENIYRIYAKSFRAEKHLETTVSEAQQIVSRELSTSEQSVCQRH